MTMTSASTNSRINSRIESRRSPSRAGYTVAEVMVAICLFAIGGSGVIAMENAAVRGNAVARRLDQATIVGNAYIDGMQRSLVTWTAGAPPVATFPSAVDGTTWNPGPSATTGYDINGFETNANIVFCIEHEDTVMQQKGGVTTVVRSDVAVYWNRDLSGFADCATAPGQGVATLHYLYLTTVLRVQAP